MKNAIVVLAVLVAVLAIPGQAGAYSLRYEQSFGTFNPGGYTLSTPSGIAVDAAGDLWIADLGNKRVMNVTNTGAFILKAGLGAWTATATPGYLKTDYDVAVDPLSGDVWVTDYGVTSGGTLVSRIQKFDGDTGLYIPGSLFGSYGTGGGGEIKNPKGVFVDAAGNIWVADSGNNRIKKFNSSGTLLLMTFGSGGTGNGQLAAPTDVVVEPGTGHVWVVDSGNNRIQEFTSAGTFIQRIGGVSGGVTLPFVGKGTGNGEFWLPTSLALDASGNVLVADSSNNRIQAFDSSGNWLLTYDNASSGYGIFNKPYGIAVDPSGSIWVSDSGNNRIVELVVPEPVTMAGLVLGLSCLTKYIRRRRTA